MRAGGCTVQQALTGEAAGVMRHAMALARQRGHAQVTPLHVAATLLAPGRGGLLRRACLKSTSTSHPHPLQCRALELCFKVALNRLPTTAGPLVQGGNSQPSLSNSLVAALKRAQAYQRRGCLEQQHEQPLLAVKVEMEHLIISILDDPSVSRVMREAGFSSTFVKDNLEEEAAASAAAAASVSFPSSFDHISRSAAKIKGFMADAAEMGSNLLQTDNINNVRTNFLENPAFENLRNSSSSCSSLVFENLRKSSGCSLKTEDVESVVEVLLGRKTRRINSVIVGDCLLTTENVVRDVIIRTERGDFPDPLRRVQFISPQFCGVRMLRREEVEQKMTELRMSVMNCLAGGFSVIIYAGDLRWAVDFRDEDRYYSSSNYCPVEHITMELGRILASYAEGRRLWLMATATYQTYMRCQMREPSLETLWGLQAVVVPSGGLNLTLQASSTRQEESLKANGAESNVLVSIPQNLTWPPPPSKPVILDDELVEKLDCCSECLTEFEAEAEHLPPANDRKLPFWLQQCNNNREINAASVEVDELRKKWNQTCSKKHGHFFDPVPLQRPMFDSAQQPDGMVLPENVVEWSTERGATFQDSTRFDVETTLALGLTDSSVKANSKDEALNWVVSKESRSSINVERDVWLSGKRKMCEWEGGNEKRNRSSPATLDLNLDVEQEAGNGASDEGSMSNHSDLTQENCCFIFQ